MRDGDVLLSRAPLTPRGDVALVFFGILHDGRDVRAYVSFFLHFKDISFDRIRYIFKIVKCDHNGCRRVV